MIKYALLLAVLFLSVAASQTLAAAQEAPGTTLSLIVSGDNLDEAKQHFEKLAWLVRNRHVQAGSVYVVGLGSIEQRLDSAESAPPLQQVLGGEAPVGANSVNIVPGYQSLVEAGVADYNARHVRELFQKLDITYSPTWVVRHLGRDYIYEGIADPKRLFTQDGAFNDAGN